MAGNKDQIPFKRGDVVYLKSAPERPLTVEHCVWGYEDADEWWIFTQYWDEPTKVFKRFNTYPEMLSLYGEPEQPKPLGF